MASGALAELGAWLASKGLKHLLNAPVEAPARALTKIKRGESPYNVLTEHMGYPTDPASRTSRSLEQGYDPEELYHFSRGDLNILEPSQELPLHLGTPVAAHVRSQGFFPEHGGSMIEESAHLGRVLDDPNFDPDIDIEDIFQTFYPMKIKKSPITPGIDPWENTHDISDFIDARIEVDGLHHIDDPEQQRIADALTEGSIAYRNQGEDIGSTSYIPISPARSRFAQFNPNWKKFRDLLAGTGALGMLSESLPEE